MTMTKLELIKRIAEIEGIELLGPNKLNHQPINGRGCIPYNPFDWSILGPLILKYEVTITHGRYPNGDYDGLAQIKGFDRAIAFSKEEIPIAILECIIKSQEA